MPGRDRVLVGLGKRRRVAVCKDLPARDSVSVCSSANG